MRLSAVACGLFACFVSQVAATALTYKIHANEKACFYAKTQKENEKVAFYFAVQSGGSFDIDYVVTGPGNKVILDGSKERQGDFVFTAQQIGDYEFCFNNEMSTFAEKFVDFEIAVENEVRAQLPSKQGASQEQHTTLEETIFKLSGQLSTISRGQKYFRTRENRNFSTVRSTESRIINFSMIQCALIVLMGALQVFIVRFFFQGARKGYPRQADRGTTVILLPERRELGELRVSVISLVCDPARSSKRPIAFLTTCDTLCDYARHTWTPPRQNRHANRTPSNTNTTFSEVVRDLSMPSGARRSSKQQRKKPREPNEPKWYTIKNILDQRQYGGTIEYLIDWDDDKKTGERFPPSWAPSKDVTSKAIFDWKKKQEEAYTQYATGSEEPESQREREEGAEDQGASSHSPTASTPDSSQPIRPPHRRKRLHSERFAEESENSQIEDSEEDEHDLSKRHCSEPPSLLSFGSEFDTDAASDILLEAPSNIFVAIPSKVEFDPTEYLSVSGSQGSTSHGSQPISTQEDEDNQGLTAKNLNLLPQQSRRSLTGRRDFSHLPAAMASTGEPMSAIEELLKMQEAAMSGDLGDDSGEHLGQLDGNGSVATGPTDTHDFSMAMENPSLQINSQPPISTDWHMGGAATSSSELPVLTSAPVQPAIQAPASEHPPTANPGDIFSGNLMAAETAQQLPMTISPSDISRSIEPDDPLAALHQLDDAPLSILPAEDTATAKSTASSPDVEQYRSGPPTSMDQSEYLVTVSFPANIRPLYLSTITVYKNEIEQFNRLCRSGEALPDETMVSAIGRLLDQLRDICDLPAPLDSGTIDALAAEDLKKHAMGTNSKYFFVGRFLERLQTSHKKVLIVVRDITIMGYLEAIIGTSDIAYSLKGLHELESDDEHSLNVVLMHTEQTLVDDLSDFDVVIGFDGGIMRTDVLSRWAQMNGRKPMLIRLMTTYSVEHLEPMLRDEMSELDRTNALLIAMFQSRGLISNDEQGEMIDGLTAHFANQVIDPEPNFGWEPEPVPTAVLDLYSDSQHQSQMPPTAEELTSRKRKADDGPQEVTKRLRVSPSPGRDGGSIDDTVRGHLNPNPTHVQVRTTQDHLDSLTTKISELEYQLAEKTTLEANLRKHVNSLSKRVKSHDKTINIIQEKHMAALKERSQFEAERDAAKQTEEKALKKSQTWQNKVQKLEEELKKKSATLDEALVDAGTVATEVFKQKTDELEKSLAKIADLEKKLESRDGELSYARDAYQTANHANSELSRENKELKEQVTEFHKQAAGSLAQIQDINSKEQIKEMQRQIAETQAISRDREKELARVEKELRTLKNGRRETRQQSVPRSPRLGMMSPRAPRTAGGSASRGTSPVPYESSGTGSTPVPGMQFLPSNNHRFNHLRE
ncbi:putative membrane protein [Colletotrichum fructicola]|nr:putative membrane protein [Colletotrichum fructicola]